MPRQGSPRAQEASGGSRRRPHIPVCLAGSTRSSFAHCMTLVLACRPLSQEVLEERIVELQRQRDQQHDELARLHAQVSASGVDRATREAVEWRERAQQLEAQVVTLRTQSGDALAAKEAAEEVQRSVAEQNAELQRRLWAVEQRARR